MNLKMLASACVLVLPGAVWALGDTSEPITAFLRTEETSFWRTAKGATVTLPIDFPKGATSAVLSVSGTSYSVDYADIVTETFTLTLPETVYPSQEDVYALTLTFDDGTVRTARLGLIAGLSDGAEGTTRCLMDTTFRKWGRIAPHGVMPVPSGATLTVNGTTVGDGDSGYTGAQGWYALSGFAAGAKVPVSLAVDGTTVTVPLTVWDTPGLLLMVR